MTISESVNQLSKKRDLIHLAILLAVAFGIGVYLIATTVLISKDGVFYIEQARKFSGEPLNVIREHSFGYPFLVFVFHRLIFLFSDNSIISGWIYSAQSVSLLCRLLALIPLYYIGRLFVGSRMSFMALLIFIVLPYAAQFGSDALRDWPHILFLATGFLLLLYDARQNKYWMYGAAGFIAGIGYMVRQECVQLLLYGSLWLLIGLVLPKLYVKKRGLLVSLFVLLICFAVPVTPYIVLRGKIVLIPPNNDVTENNSVQATDDQVKITGNSDMIYSASSIQYNILKTIGGIFSDVSENLMIYFVPAWLIGIYYRFRKYGEASQLERFYVPAFVILNLIMLIVVGCYWGYTSRRYSLPLLAFTCFYIPSGFKYFSDLLNSRFPWKSVKTDRSCSLWFNVLLVIGVIICLPKLLRPINSEKRHYLKAAQWLSNNTNKDELIAVPDKRVSFYAERQALMHKNKVPDRANYIVTVIKDGRGIQVDREVPGAKKIFSASGKSGISDIEVHDLSGCISENISLTGYHWEKVSDEKYLFGFTFKVNDGFEKDWAIYFHSWPKEELALSEGRRGGEFENWDFYPEPVTSFWQKNNYITVQRMISAKPIIYDIKLGFYRASEGQYGRGVNLGWIDLGKTTRGKGW